MMFVWVILGTALGGMARYWCSGFIGRCIGETFPWGTLIVNSLGSFIIGLAAALSEGHGALAGDPSLRAFIMSGLCGGYTTFSSFSLQTLILTRDGEWLRALGNIIASLVLCLGGVTIGYLLGMRFSA